MRTNDGWREIVALATPVVIAKLSFTAMGMVDTAMVGRLGATEQGAVGIATTYMFTLFVFGLGVLGVVNTYVSQNHGAGRRRACGLVLGQGLRLAVAMGAVTLAALFLSAPLFSWAGLSDGVASSGYEYLFYRSLGLPGVFGYWAYNGFMEGLGRTRTAMKLTVVGNLINIVGDYLLIFGPGPFPQMGVAGAGLATAVANLVMLGCFVAVVHRPRGPFAAFGPELVRRPLHGPTVRRMLRTGLPMGLQFFLEIGAFLVFSVMVGWVGDVALAANQVALRLMSFSFMTTWGIATAATTLVGRYQGEGRPGEAMAAGRRALVLSLIFTGACAVLFIGGAGPLVRVFTPDPRVAAIAVPLLLVAAVFQVFDGINGVSYGALRGAGDTRWPMWVVVGINWSLGVPLVYLLTVTAGLGALGAWLGMGLMMAVQATALWRRFARGGWTAIELVERDGGAGSEGRAAPPDATAAGVSRRSRTA